LPGETEENHKNSVSMASLRGDIWVWDLPNTKHVLTTQPRLSMANKYQARISVAFANLKDDVVINMASGNIRKDITKIVEVSLT
jgi:hypothetical protein